VIGVAVTECVSSDDFALRRQKVVERFDGVEAAVLRLEERLESAGYFAKKSTAHPLTDRLAEIEHSLSSDVWTAGLSKKLRRLIVVGVLVAVAALAGTSIALAEDVHVNLALQHNDARRSAQIQAIVEQMQDNDQERTTQMERVLAAVEANNAKIAATHHNTNSEIAQIESALARMQALLSSTKTP
jgi:alkylhydroperoxidase/carboxymuconolactone decarboxylase family protein YurZ